MIDPMVSLAFSVYSNKGAFALLLGSGISRASGIPTGWDIVLDLIRKTSKLQGENCEPDPEEYFRKKYNAEPDYSKLLDQIAQTPTERQQLLRDYFEATENERSQGLKLPSRAHKAVAQLASAGYLRVILTTNFDRLMERALEEVGITPTVISTPDQVAGAPPLAHSGVTVIKLHGDYLDSRIRNTERELASYDQAFDQFLDRTLDDYGLIICGWSGDWDHALRAAIERCPSRRLTTFWAVRDPLREKGKALANYRKAVTVPITDADQFFQQLQEKVSALAELNAPHPLSAKMAAATVKRYLVDPSAKIRLHDLVDEETEKLFTSITAPAFAGYTDRNLQAEVTERINCYNSLSETLISMLVIGGHWGSNENRQIWTKPIQRSFNLPHIDGITSLINLRRYPALLLMYCTGLAAISGENYLNLKNILTSPINRAANGAAICASIRTWGVMNGDVGRLLPGMERRKTPASDYLFAHLREPLRAFLPLDEDYETAFDRLEYLICLINTDIAGAFNAPIGRFIWRNQYANTNISNRITAEIDADGNDSPFIRAGFFGGSIERLKKAKSDFDDYAKNVRP